MSLRAAIGIALGFALGVAWLGCQGASEIGDERARKALGTGEPRVLVIPMNTGITLASGLEAGAEPVQREILRQLEASPARVSFLAEDDAIVLWRETMAELRSLDRNAASLEVVAGTYVRALRNATDFDFALMPALGYREATVNERAYANWDGATRSMTARHREWAFEERVPAWSLFVQVYKPDGDLWLERWSGLDLLPDGDLDSTRGLRPEEVEASMEFIRRGVARALDLDG